MSEEHPDKVEALAALLAGEENAIAASGQVTLAVVGVIGAYLPVSLFAVYQGYGKEIIGYLPLPVVLLMFYQFLHLAAASRRAESVAIIEAELSRIGDVQDEYSAGRIGTRAQRPVVDLTVILRERGDRWVSRAVAAIVPSFGLPAVGIVYTWFLCSEAARLNPDYPVRAWAAILPILLNVVLWTMFVDSVMSYFTPAYKINIWVVLAAVVGIWLQWHSPENETAPWLFFSIASAALIAIVAVTRPLNWRGLDVVERAGIAGILVAVLGFWVLVFPEVAFGRYEASVWANVAMHIVAPLAAILGVVARRSPLRPLPWRKALATLIFPVPGTVMVLIAHLGFDQPLPYDFLDPARGGWGITIAVMVAAAVVFVLVCSVERILLALRPTLRRDTIEP